MMVSPNIFIYRPLYPWNSVGSFTDTACHMKLYLMRHGQAASPQVDPQQGLTPEGRIAIEQLAQALVIQGMQFTQVFHSEKARARQTAEIMTRLIAPTVSPQQRAGLKPNDDPRLLLAEIENWQDDTLITSHLPFIPNLLSLLTGDLQSIVLAPGTVVCLVKENTIWRIEWVESP